VEPPLQFSCANCVLLGGSQINSSGVFVGAGVSTPSYGVNAGSYAIAGTTIIDGSRNVSTTGYLNGASVSIGGTLNDQQFAPVDRGCDWGFLQLIRLHVEWKGVVRWSIGPISSSGEPRLVFNVPRALLRVGDDDRLARSVRLELVWRWNAHQHLRAFVGAGVSVAAMG